MSGDADLGAVRVLVPRSVAAKARAILAELDRGG